jgi:hypothetical protein
MNVTGMVTNLIAGGVGGNIAGALLKKFDLGPIGNTVGRPDWWSWRRGAS